MVVVEEEEATTSGRVLLKASPDDLGPGSALHTSKMSSTAGRVGAC